jgi:hypothetical protein
VGREHEGELRNDPSDAGRLLDEIDFHTRICKVDGSSHTTYTSPDD